MKKLKYFVRQCVKMMIQSIFLPVLYRIYAMKKVDDRLIVFADAHHTSTPYSMQYMHHRLEDTDYRIIDCYEDYQKSLGRTFFAMCRFMKVYARASYVFICDNFLPVASCKKRKETRVIQLWHAGGILKKYAYDTTDDIPAYYKKNVFANYDYLSVSAPCCIPVYNHAMRQPDGVVHASGLSRTDTFFEPDYEAECRKQLYQMYPATRGKHILVWAPTFREKADHPEMLGDTAIRVLEEKLGEDWVVLIKAHPHIDAKQKVSNCDIPTEQLLPVADLLITDYSSVIFDYVLFEKPLVLFVPDYKEYQKKRGFYIELSRIPAKIVIEEENLYDAVCAELEDFDKSAMHEFRMQYMGSCDGHATDRICIENNIKLG